jgi:hypothetical protein
MYQAFRDEVISQLPRDVWHLSDDEVEAWAGEWLQARIGEEEKA